MSSISQLIGRGIGFNPGGIQYIITAGLLSGQGTAPTITSVVPNAAPIPYTVIINGTNLSGATSVTLAGIPVTYSVISSTQISFTIPYGATSGYIVVVTGGGTATSSSIFYVYANQSASVASVMTAFYTVLTNIPMLPKGVVIREWYGAARPRYEGESMVFFRPKDDQPFLNDGAARFGHRYVMLVEVVVCTRYAKDTAGTHVIWSRDQARGHWFLRQAVVDALQDKNLWFSYSAGQGVAPILTIAPVQQVTSRGPKKGPQEVGKNDQGWGESPILFAVPLVQQLIQ